MKNKKIIFISCILILIVAINLVLAISYLQSQKNIYTHTKAICNESNYCQDYYIMCREKKLINKNPITGASVQFPENWEDPRNKQKIEELC